MGEGGGEARPNPDFWTRPWGDNDAICQHGEPGGTDELSLEGQAPNMIDPSSLLDTSRILSLLAPLKGSHVPPRAFFWRVSETRLPFLASSVLAPPAAEPSACYFSPLLSSSLLHLFARASQFLPPLVSLIFKFSFFLG